MISLKSAVFLAGCLGLFSPIQSAVAQTPPFDEAHKLEFDDLKLLDNALNALVQTGQTTNLTYGVWQRGKLVRDGYFGPVSPRNSSQVANDTIFSIQSMTKAVTAVGILILVERGAFELDDPMTDILPEFEDVEVVADQDASGNLFTYQPPRPPTIRQLLSHTAGLGNARPSLSSVETKLWRSEILSARTIDEVIGIASSVPYIAAPGAEWNYSISSDLQGAMIERVSGERLGSFLQRELFEPLGMHDTGFFVHQKNIDRLSGVLHHAPSGNAFQNHDDTHNSIQSRAYHEGGHGLFSTQADYYRFLEFLLNDGDAASRRLLKPDTLAEFRQNAIRYRGRPGSMSSIGRRQGLGFGFGVGTIENSAVSDMAAPEGSYYWYGALGTWFWVDPVNEIIFIAMAQTDAPMESDYIRDSMRLVYGDPSSEDTHSVTANRRP